MRRRDFGWMMAGLGLAAVAAPLTAFAAPTLASGSKFKVKSVKKDGKFHLEATATVTLKKDEVVKWVYTAEFGEKKEPALSLVQEKAGTGAAGEPTVFTETLKDALAKSPTKILVVTAGKPKGEPIVVEQPGS